MAVPPPLCCCGEGRTVCLPARPPSLPAQGPFTYEALPPEDIKFVPLKQSREFNAKELMEVGARLRAGD